MFACSNSDSVSRLRFAHSLTRIKMSSDSELSDDEVRSSGLGRGCYCGCTPCLGRGRCPIFAPHMYAGPELEGWDPEDSLCKWVTGVGLVDLEGKDATATGSTDSLGAGDKGKHANDAKGKGSKGTDADVGKGKGKATDDLEGKDEEDVEMMSAEARTAMIAKRTARTMMSAGSAGDRGTKRQNPTD